MRSLDLISKDHTNMTGETWLWLLSSHAWLNLLSCIGIPKIHMQLFISASIYFVLLLFQFFICFPVHAIFLSWLCNHWSSNIRLTYPPVDCKEFIKQPLRKGYIWKKNNYSFYSLSYDTVVSKRTNAVSLLIQKGTVGLLGRCHSAVASGPHLEWLHLSHFRRWDHIGATWPALGAARERRPPL